MKELSESITRSGVLHPALLLPNEDKDGCYYYIAGHRRGLASEKAGLSDIPAIIKDITMDEATILMVDTNLQQREVILPSEKAWAYRMKLEAMKRQGNRSDLTSGQVVPKLNTQTAREIIADDANENYRQISRYIRLTYLIPDFRDLVDTGRMAFGPAVDVSFLTDKHQQNLLEIMGAEMVSPSIEQAANLKKAEQNGHLDFKLIHMIMKQQKPNQLTIKLSSEARERVYAYFPKEATPLEIENGILEGLEMRKQAIQRKNRQQSR